MKKKGILYSRDKQETEPKKIKRIEKFSMWFEYHFIYG